LPKLIAVDLDEVVFQLVCDLQVYFKLSTFNFRGKHLYDFGDSFFETDFRRRWYKLFLSDHLNIKYVVRYINQALEAYSELPDCVFGLDT